MRLFHSATIFAATYVHVYICCLNLHQADYQVGEGFLSQFWWGALSFNVFTICAVYWSLGRRGYFGVSNVVLVVIDRWSISCEIAFRWMPLYLITDDKSTLGQVMAWCHQATSHYLSQCCPRSLSPFNVTRPQWVNTLRADDECICQWTDSSFMQVMACHLAPSHYLTNTD